MSVCAPGGREVRLVYVCGTQPAGLDFRPQTSGAGDLDRKRGPSRAPSRLAAGCALPDTATSSPSWNLRNPSLTRWKICF